MNLPYLFLIASNVVCILEPVTAEPLLEVPGKPISNLDPVLNEIFVSKNASSSLIGRSLFSRQSTCPSNAPLNCGVGCCETGDKCCPTTCCPIGSSGSCCPDSMGGCCPTTSNCVSSRDGCCPKTAETCGGEQCYEEDAVCCDSSVGACAPGSSCCGTKCCRAGTFCCEDAGCCDVGETCCSGKCCPSGYECDGAGLCRLESITSQPGGQTSQSKGLSAGGKAGVGVGVTVGAVGMAGMALLIWKYFHPPSPPPATAPAGTTAPDGFIKPMADVSVQAVHCVPPPGQPSYFYMPPPGQPGYPVMPPPLLPPQPSNPPAQPRAGNEPYPYDTQQNLGDQPTQPTNNPYQPTSDFPPSETPQQPQTDPQQPPTDNQPQPPADQQPPELPDHPDRLPKIRRGVVKKHHHHHYLDPRQECLAEHCEFNLEHDCQPNTETCPCTCRDKSCPVTQERERRQKEVDGVHTLLANTL